MFGSQKSVKVSTFMLLAFVAVCCLPTEACRGGTLLSKWLYVQFFFVFVSSSQAY